MRYRFTTDYQSGFGQWGAGDTAEFDEITARWLLNDVPGCIEPITEGQAETRAVEEAPANRQVTAARNRKPPANQGEIDKTSFKAVRDTR